MKNLTRSFTVCALAIGIAACSKGDDGAIAKPESKERLQTMLEKADSTTVVPLVAGDTLHLSTATIDFYRRRKWRAAWATEDNLTDQGKKILSAVAGADADGLSPVRYRYDVIQKMLASLKTDQNAALDDAARAQYAADLDLMLTEAFTRYAYDLAQGTLAPDSAGLKWRIPRGGIPKANLLRALAKGDDPQGVIQRVRPTAPQYGRLQKVLLRLEEA